jgi:hypothetical protein
MAAAPQSARLGRIPGAAERRGARTGHNSQEGQAVAKNPDTKVARKVDTKEPKRKPAPKKK